MIFWGTVLAFILGIMYYMLYPYDTKISTVYMPASEAYVASFVAQHQAAKDYAREAVIAINQITKQGALAQPSSVDSSAKNAVYILSADEINKSAIDSFFPEHVASAETSDFFPGRSSSSFSWGNTSFSDLFSDEPLVMGDFVSVLACFDQPERKLNGSDNYTRAKLTDCKAATTKYVMTYGPVPEELDKPYMKGKTLLWEVALLKRTKGNPDCGYLYYDSKMQRYFINNSRHLTRTVPNPFMSLFRTSYFKGYDDIDGRVYAGGDNSREVMFCMTPVNDPYPRLGLQVLLDGTINQLSDGFKIKHASQVPADGWINLAKENNNKIAITGTGSGTAYWNPTCSKTSDLCHADGFSFNGSRGLTIQPGVFDSAKPRVLIGVPATVSLFGLFKEGDYTVFKTVNNTGGADAPHVEARFYHTQFSVTLTYKSKQYILSGYLGANQMRQVDYILNAGGHKLYVDGKLVKEATFDEIIGPLEGESLIIGGTSSKFVLYNFLLYNRSPAENTTTIDTTFDLYGLTRIYKSNTLRYLNEIGKTGTSVQGYSSQRRMNE